MSNISDCSKNLSLTNLVFRLISYSMGYEV